MIDIRPLTPDRWDDFATLMGPRGGADGCWCTIWRQSAKDYRANRGDANRNLMRQRVETARPPGLLAYEAEAPVGWISLAPRQEFPRMAASRILAPEGAGDDWVVTCFFIKAGQRGKGIGTALLKAACEFAAGQGATRLTGYPIDPGAARYANSFAWTGIRAAFTAAGFQEAARRSEKRPVMVRHLTPPSGTGVAGGG